MVFTVKEADWNQDGKRLREEVKYLRQVMEKTEEKIREMEVGIMEKNSEKEWELMGTKLLLEQMKEERARGDEVMEKWKQLYLAIKPELDDLIERTYDEFIMALDGLENGQIQGQDRIKLWSLHRI
ncbi:hypothetical protein RJT34_15874 [Clitoria ternatea]|uniref:Uncharacterized protein n=1 Tax=Clitoria ternatea TaxID=43366 RepID=A0AAN9PD69_CLITE